MGNIAFGLGVWTLGIGALAGSAAAQGRTAVATHQQAAGGGLVLEDAVRPAGPGPGSQAVLAGGALWTRADSAWVPMVVSLGAQGTQVFGMIEHGQDHAELLSGFSPNPAAPAWLTNLPIEMVNAVARSAETADVHASAHQLVQNGNNSTRTSVVCRWRSGTSTPEWVYTFPGTTSGLARVGISRDGSRIVAAALYPMELKLRLAVFQGSSGTPVHTAEIPNFGVQLRGFLLSDDGSTVYAASSSTAFVWNATTHAVVGQAVLPGGFDCHALSGDGRVFAFGQFNKVHIWERNTSGSYGQTHVRELPGPLVCNRLGLSADGSTLAIGWQFYDQALRVRIEALDVPTKALVMADEAAGTGSYQNVVSAVSVSDDGSRFAVGLWGDQGDVCPEVRFYRRNQNAPVALHNLPGSVHDLEISGDGQRVAVAWKSVHANTFAGGGGWSLYSFGEMDLRVHGVPRPGSTLSIEMTGPVGSPARLLWSPLAAATPQVFPGIGTLRLQRTTTTAVAVPATNGAGWTQANHVLPAGASEVGRTYYFQGLFTTPRRLTADWARVTILP